MNVPIHGAQPDHDETPAAEYRIDEGLVRRLLVDQHPDLADLPLRAVGEGWDNAIFRLGDRLAVRLPRRTASAILITREQRWLPVLSRQVSLPVPAPYRVGKPALGYPWCWSVTPWLKGSTADQVEPAATQAAVFGEFLRSLHVPAPADAPASEVRGVPLSRRAGSMKARLDRLAGRTALITREVRQSWEHALEAIPDFSPTWLHGDLHPRNVLVDQGTITAVIDWGDVCAGDPATDLASNWMLFADRRSREAFWHAYGAVSVPSRQRAKGWAILFGVTLLDTGLSNHPGNAAMGRRILGRVTEETE